MPDVQFSNLPDVQRPLLEKFYRAYRSPMRARGEAQVWVARQADIVGALCLTPIAGGHWLTGLFVAPAERGRGVAAGLIAAALTSVEGNVWLFCEPELRGFYQRIGFVEVQDLPQELAGRLARYRHTKPLISLVRPAD
ncbi:GNAT family N-acetyltransferase [Pseudomonas petrae]|uniref:GNAT family N-acetyltransferase n=1 Tax=Pseudomonas petrae TaxID=2912190 RepID=A0ABS9IBI0_9PSED|nr:GNAT family N-acetyltransferase [Pseudomonas petrae]MCF7535398.1 GNAT family N-acetyltransferase [Pseudomonas petrae]MCF7540244.1 GNAT family N-acetyltransferase [Pseudomonas petrae]MCF7545075.1 GNAT family N-acetyltransferase [Pseudomonas petrae]MCF7558787.1 GNAT family N-acetyltransferase [Pseudomonas petrae]